MTAVHPIQPPDLPDVAQFLHEQLGRRFSAQAWAASLTQTWAAAPPNMGMHLRHKGRVVGVFCAIYSDQTLAGRTERFCNPHSWVVLEAHRSSSLSLVLALIRQRGYHFTMFTPNPKVAQVFMGLRFKLLDDRLLYLPNLPAPGGRGRRSIVETDRGRIGAVLEGVALQDFLAHKHLPWLEFVAFGQPGDTCLAVYKRTRWKKMACAAIAHLSDTGAIDRHGALLRHHLLLSGMPVSRVEGRHLTRTPALAWRTRRGQPKLVLSSTLADHQVHDLYSELMALDL